MCSTLTLKNNTRYQGFTPSGTGDGEGAPIHMPMIRLETVENHLNLTTIYGLQVSVLYYILTATSCVY